LAKGKKRANRLGAHLVFLDESGFLLIPNVKRTWAPKGQTPIIRHQIRNGKLSAISALSVSPKYKRIALYLQFRQGSLRGPQIEAFLSNLLRQINGPIILLWDRNPIHKYRTVRTFIEQHPRLHDEFFPGYAPELNPAEYVWAQTDAALDNSAPEDVTELQELLKQQKRRLRNSELLLWSCIYASDLPWRR
jgi:transposase